MNHLARLAILANIMGSVDHQTLCLTGIRVHGVTRTPWTKATRRRNRVLAA